MDDTYGDLNRCVRITEGLDERGLVLSLAAFADEALAELISAFMQPGEAAVSLVKGFNAPLGTFSARIKAAYALNLITLRQQENLDRLRKIRNEFAHNWKGTSFSNQALASHIAALKFSPLVDKFPESSIDKVRIIISSLLVELRSASYQINKKGLSSRYIGIELIPGLRSNGKDKMAECKKSLDDTIDELNNSTGERRSYLLAQQERWAALLEIFRLNEAASSRS